MGIGRDCEDVKGVYRGDGLGVGSSGAFTGFGMPFCLFSYFGEYFCLYSFSFLLFFGEVSERERMEPETSNYSSKKCVIDRT